MSKSLGVGIAGLGTVGGGFLKQLKSFKTNSKSESNVKIVAIAVKNIKKKRNFNILKEFQLPRLGFEPTIFKSEVCCSTN